MLTLLKQYFEKFGDKACCFEDLKPFLDLEEAELAQLTSFLEAVPTSSVSQVTIPFVVLLNQV